MPVGLRKQACINGERSSAALRSSCRWWNGQIASSLNKRAYHDLYDKVKDDRHFGKCGQNNADLVSNCPQLYRMYRNVPKMLKLP